MNKFKFSDIATISTQKKKPTDEDKFHYIGLEHLDSKSLKVTRYGADVAPKGEKLVMKKGDVLFGKRRAYQKKVAIAPFDGIFSAHGMILRPNEKVISRELFPFFISSDAFLDKAIKISVGSLSPTINNSDIKKLEFELPDIREQEKYSNALFAINDTKEAYINLIGNLDKIQKSRFIELFGDLNTNPFGFEVKKLSEIAEYYNGVTYKPENIVDSKSGFLVLRSSNIQNGQIAFDDNVYINMNIKDKHKVEDNDILMCSRNGSAKLVGKVALIHDCPKDTCFGAFMMIIRSKFFNYLYSYFQSTYFRQRLVVGATSTINQITVSMLDNIKLPIPPIELVNKYTEQVKQIDKSKFNLKCAITELDNLSDKIKSEIFS